MSDTYIHAYDSRGNVVCHGRIFFYSGLPDMQTIINMLSLHPDRKRIVRLLVDVALPFQTFGR